MCRRIDNLITLQTNDEKFGKEIYRKAVDVVNYLLCDVDILSVLRNIPMSGFIFKRAKLFPQEAMLEIMDENESLRKAIGNISEFSCRYPE